MSEPALELKGGETRLDDAIRNNPFPFYRELRREKPVYYDPGLDVYLVTRYADAVRVLGDDVTFSLEHGYQDRYANGFLEEFAAIMERDGGGFIRDLAIDPPKHTRLRRLTEKAFTAHRVKDLEPRIRQIVVATVDSVQTSCGFGVPLMSLVGQRDQLPRWAENKGEADLVEYRRTRNAVSLDGLLTPPTDI